MISRIWDWLHSSDAITWASHGFQGFIIPIVAVTIGLSVEAGIFAVLVHFSLREIPGLIIALKAGNTPALRDGLFDLMAPVAGIALYALLLG